MKKFILPFVAAVLMGVVTSSCTKDVLIESVNTYTDKVVVTSSNWVTTDGLNYYFCDISWNAITDEVLEHGTVDVYCCLNGVQNPLPYILPMTYPEGTVGETIRFQCWNGTIRLILEDIDGLMPSYLSELPDYTFRLVATVPVAYEVAQ